MHSASSTSDVQALLALKRKIDAICDRFEQAWSEGRRPRIEDFLSELPSGHRPQLFQELLSSELAFRSPVDPNVAYSDYLSRFPEFEACVLEAFSNYPTHKVDADDSLAAESREKLIENARKHLLADNHEANSVQNGVTGYVATNVQPDQQSAVPEPLAEQLWDLLIRGARISPVISSDKNAAGLAAITQQLLTAFPSVRRSMLRDALLGRAVSQVARVNQSTERTVTATLQTAIDLLKRSAS